MNDFADWLSPILVKELRQGLRSRSFVSLFILMQLLMTVVVLVALMDDHRTGSTVFFWIFVVGGFLGFLPARGLTVVSSELKGQTMELMSLTQLSPWRIVTGKWVALVAQTTLFLCSVLPYVGLRYFLGEVDLVMEMQTVGLLFLGSMALTAVAVGLSALFVNQLYFAGLVVMGLLMPYVIMALSFMLFDRTGVRGSSGMSPHHLWLLAPWLALICIEVSATRISSPGEGRKFYQRLFTLGLVLTIAGLAFAFGNFLEMAILAACLVSPLLVIDIVSAPPPMAGLYRAPKGWRFSKIPVLRGVTRWLSEPGWVRGLTFSLLVTTMVFVIALPAKSERTLELFIPAMGMLMMPLLFMNFFTSITQKAALYFCTQVLFFGFSLPFVFNYVSKAFAVAIFIPATTFWVLLLQKKASGEVSLLPSILTTLVIAAFLIRRAWKERPERMELRRRANELPDL